MTDRIEIRGLRAHGHHGVMPQERADGQPFVIDVVLEADLGAAARSDDLADTVDYGRLGRRLADEVAATRFDLIERLAAHLLDVVLEDGRVSAAEIRVAKPHAPMDVDFTDVAVRMRRERR